MTNARAAQLFDPGIETVASKSRRGVIAIASMSLPAAYVSPQ